jgi:hypothetical protein
MPGLKEYLVINAMKIFRFIWLFLYIITIGAFVSCNNDNVEVFTLAEEYVIPRDNNSNFVEYFVSDSTESVVVFNQADSMLAFRNLTDMRLRDEIPLHGILKNESEKKYLSRFVVHRRDSVFVQYRNHFFLLDDNGRVLNDWDGAGALVFESSNYEITSMAPFTFFGARLYFPLVGSYDLTKPEGRKQYFSAVHPVASLDINTNEWALLPVAFPEIYQNGDFYLDVVPFIGHYRDALVVSFGLSDSIYFYDAHTAALIGFPCVSKYKENPVPFDDDSSYNMIYRKRYDFEQFRYADIFVDQQQNLLYRVASLPTPLHQKDGFTNRKAKDWSLIIFDIETKAVIAEQRFDSEMWAPFVVNAGDGLLVLKMADRAADSLRIVKLKYYQPK